MGGHSNNKTESNFTHKSHIGKHAYGQTETFIQQSD